MNFSIKEYCNILEYNYQNNIEALKYIDPNLSALLDKTSFERTSIEFMSNMQINIVKDNQYIYGKDPTQEIKDQVNLYLDNPQNLQEMAPNPNMDSSDTLFHSSYNKISKCIPEPKYYKKTNNKKKKYNIPLYIIFGVGLGYHIEQLIKHYNIRHLIIVEDDLEIIKISLHTANWTQILNHFQDSNKSLDLIYGHDGRQTSLHLLNAIYQTNPIFITNAHFYKHYSREMFSQCMDTLVEKYLLPSLGWGYFDDEYATIQQTIANIQKNVPLLCESRNTFLDIPVFIVASGPSLDTTIQTIKNFKDRAIILSCGTALSPLYKEGIKPDFHIEMERPYSKYENLMKCADSHYISSLNIIAPCRVHPMLFSVSKNSFSYVKYPDAGGIFADARAIRIHYDNPTVTNAAFSIACELGFNEIYLFGVDLGCKKKEFHHSKHTIYYNELNKKNQSKKYNINIKDINDENMYTSDVFYWTKNALENRIKEERNITVLNASHGAKIEGTTLIYDKNLDFPSLPYEKSYYNGIIKSMFYTNINDFHVTNTKLNNLSENFDFAIQEISSILGNHVNHSSEIIDRFNYIHHFLENQLKEKSDACSILLRGSFKHFSRLIFTYAAACQDESIAVDFINQSLTVVYEFLDQAREKIKALEINP